MTRSRVLASIGLAFLLLLLAVIAGAWWYLFGPNAVSSAELVPANTVAFATIPNAAALLAGYNTSQLKTLVDSPNTQPVKYTFVNFFGGKTADLLNAFAPNLSGESFIALTHFDYNHPERAGLIAAMKPKAGLDNFDAFVEKLKTTWPDTLKQGRTGTGSVAGVDYQWIQGPGATDKICVAKTHGWIVTTWGEASLQDWIERYEKKSSTPSLAQDPDYQKSVARVGENPMTLLYLNYRAVADILQKQMAKTNPATGDYISKKLASIGGAALGSRFESGEIVDRFSLLIPRQAQLDAGATAEPCPFDTLKFTGPNTRLYWAFNVNWQQYYKTLQEEPAPLTSQNASAYPTAATLISFLQGWTRGAGLDLQHNIIDALGAEVSLQLEWNPDTTYPELGAFVKLDKPDDFKPVITALIESVRRTFETTAVIREVSSNGQSFAALKFVQASPIAPTITEGGPYLGIFMSENQAVRSYQRDPTLGLTNNADFNRQIGDKRSGASQIIFLDSPRLLDRAYQTAMPYLSLASMFNKQVAAFVQGKNFPTDLSWLAPMGTWSCIVTPDVDGLKAYSVSGIGNQGIVLAGVMGGAAGVMQSMGVLPRTPSYTYLPGTPPVPPPTLLRPTLPGGRIAGPTPPALYNFNPAPEPGPTSVIYITPDGKLFFDQTSVDPTQIGDFLKAKKAANENMKLVVHVDQKAPPALLSMVMDAGASAGFGVLPTVSTLGAESLPPVTNSALPVTPPTPDGATNAAPPLESAPAPAPGSVSTAGTNSDATSPVPAPTNTP